MPRVRGAGAPGGPQLPETGRAGPPSCLAALGSLLSTCAAVATVSVPSVAQALLPCFLFVIIITSGGGTFRVGMKWHLVVLTCISMTGEVERPVVLWPLMYLLWRKTYSSPFPMFELGWLIFCQVVGVLKNISWILTPYRIYDW